MLAKLSESACCENTKFDEGAALASARLLLFVMEDIKQLGAMDTYGLTLRALRTLLNECDIQSPEFKAFSNVISIAKT